MVDQDRIIKINIEEEMMALSRFTAVFYLE